MKKIVSVLAVALALVGCATSKLHKRQLERQGQPPEYVEGYVDGCDSGEAAAGYIYSQFTKNPNRFDRDSLYRQGWNDGFQVCKTRMLTITH